VINRVWQTSASLFAGLLVTAMYAMPQAYTVSAKPGAINYIEGHAYLNGQPLSDKSLRSTFLNANDTLSTDIGKAEVLLTPGVFMRLGDNTRVRMISPSLTNTQVEVKGGEVMVEADGLLKDNNIQVIDHGASITLAKNGLYRFTADDNPSAAVIEGRAEVYFGDKKVDLGKGHQTLLATSLAEQKFDTKKEDDLYAWSNERSKYDAASSYQTATNSSLTNYNSWGGYGFDSFYSPGWYWNSAFNGYGWLPGSGAFYSPFGYGFFGGAYLPYAPVMVMPVGGGQWRTRTTGTPTSSGTRTVVPVNPNRLPAVGMAARSPFANDVARGQITRSFAGSGAVRTASGAPVASFSGGARSAASAPAASSSGGGWHGAGGGWHGGGGGVSGGGGGHSGGGGGGHR
jgi:hypothetical protein